MKSKSNFYKCQEVLEINQGNENLNPKTVLKGSDTAKVSVVENLIEKSRLNYLESVPLRFQGLMRRLYGGRLSPRQVIKAKCIQCCNFEDIGKNVAECKAITCANYLLRPYQKSENEGHSNE